MTMRPYNPTFHPNKLPHDAIIGRILNHRREQGRYMSHSKAKSKPLWLALAMLLIVFGAGATANGAFAGMVTSLPTNLPTGSAAAPAAQKAAPVTCADIERLGLDKQMNQHAAELVAGCRGIK